ncbi:glycosyltransferase [Vibrio sp. SCSIO 43137]|uniref:glycosyltransferase n=1 Tax=Vibrio sp. SCSIO 43137 TaxID=3021011 RepID=UPI00230730E9|nr:glycosyltransferase [Vibrio sp. SCSIO 43137]WCE31977.1 glycosyltransferase [Vibrio sp. SCSIO 43137]
MSSRKRNILLVHYGDNWIRGSEQTLLSLVDNLDRCRFTPFVWSNNPRLHQQLQQRNVGSFLSPFKVLLGWQKPRFAIFSWLQQCLQAYRLIKENNIDLVHVNGGAPCQWMWLVCRLCGIPMLLHLHSDYPLRDRLTLGFGLATQVVTVSNAISHSLLKDGYPQQRQKTIYNGFSGQQDQQPVFDVKKHLGLDSSTFLLVSCGSLIQRKGMDLLIRAMASVRKHDQGVHLLIIGGGPEYHSLLTLARQLDITDHIHFSGEQSNVPRWMAGCDAFVSGASSEAFGLVIGEATLAGLAVIAPATGGIPELVQHNVSALLYTKGSQAQLAQHIVSLRGETDVARRLTTNARQRITTKFTVQHYISAFQSEYQRLLCTPVSPPSIGSFIATALRTTLAHITDPLSNHLNFRLNLIMKNSQKRF